MCARHTVTSRKHVFAIRNLFFQGHIRKYIGWNMKRHKPGKITACMMLFSLLRVEDNKLSSQNRLKRLQNFVLISQRMVVTCTYHLSPNATISIYGWRYQARHHHCAYGNGLPCFFCLRWLPFTLQVKYLRVCVSSWEKGCRNVLKQVLWKLWFIHYLYLIFSASTNLEIMYIPFHRKKTATKRLAKEKDLFPIKLHWNVIIKYNCLSIFFMIFCSYSTKFLIF